MGRKGLWVCSIWCEKTSMFCGSQSTIMTPSFTMTDVHDLTQIVCMFLSVGGVYMFMCVPKKFQSIIAKKTGHSNPISGDEK